MTSAATSGESGAPNPLLLGVLRFLLRLFISVPITSNFAWRLAPLLRERFRSDHETLAIFDRRIRIHANLSQHIESQIFWHGVQEGDRGKMRLLAQLLRPSDVFLDIGANVGVFSLFGAARLRDGQVHAFEPYEPHLSRFRDNIALNGYRNISVNALALSNEAGRVNLHVPLTNNTGMASFFPDEGDARQFSTHSVETMTLDAYVARQNIRRVDIIKMDVEGAELQILEGGLRTIKSHSPDILMEVNVDHISRAGSSLAYLIGFFDGIGYEISKIMHDGSTKPIYGPADFDEHQNIHCFRSGSGKHLR